jgi:hypothetical protein
MPPDGLTTLEQGGFDGILLGPVGDPRVPDHVTLWGLVLPLCQTFDHVVIATKLRHPMRSGPNGKGLSRKAIMTEAEQSLSRCLYSASET